MEDGQDVMPALWRDVGGFLGKPDGVSRAFILAVVLHAAGAIVLGLSIRYWPAVPTPQPAHLELDLEASPPPSSRQVAPEPPALAQALASVPAEVRTAEALPAPIPEVRGAPFPEPAVMMAQSSDARGIVVPAIGREQPAAPAGLSLPVRPAAVFPPGDAGGHPTALSEIQPHYPYAARTRGEEGKVTVHVQINGNGEVAMASIGESSGFPALDESALSAARKARFKPAERLGLPVPSEMNLRFDFRLQD